jgi:hypothetical protein
MTSAFAYVFFEVMDKEPSLLVTAILYGVLAALGYLLSRQRWWWGLLSLPFVAALAWRDVSELYDPFVGPAIVREAGYGYVLGWHALIIAGFALPVTSALWKRASIRR